MRETKIKVWDTVKKTMTRGMTLPMLAGFLTAKFPDLGNEEYLQWTGLKDRKGQEIWEGDIMKIKVKNQFGSYTDDQLRVEYDEAYAQFIGRPTDERTGIYVPLGDNGDGEVIGNIYEHSNLLKCPSKK